MEDRGPYTVVNLHVPVLRTYFDGADTRRDFRLSRLTLRSLINTLEDGQGGWGKTMEVLIITITIIHCIYIQ